MILTYDTSSGRDNNFCRIIFKPHQFSNFGMKLRVGYDSGMPKLKVSAIILTFDLGTWFLHATHRLVTMIISAKQVLNPTMYDEVMCRT